MHAIGNELFRFVAFRPIPRGAVDLGDEGKLPVPGAVAVTGDGLDRAIADAATLAAEGRRTEARERLAGVLAIGAFRESVAQVIADWRPLTESIHRVLPDAAQLAALVTELRRAAPAEVAAGAAFRNNVRVLYGALFASVIAAPSETQTIATLVRILRTLMLVEALVRAPDTLVSRDAIRAALRRPILIGAGLGDDQPQRPGGGAADNVAPARADDAKKPSFAEFYGALGLLDTLSADQFKLVLASDEAHRQPPATTLTSPAVQPRGLLTRLRDPASMRIDTVSAPNEAPVVVIADSVVARLPHKIVDLLTTVGADPRRAPVSRVRRVLEMAARDAYMADRSRANERGAQGATARFYFATANYQYSYGTYGAWPPPGTVVAVPGAGTAPAPQLSPAIQVAGIADLLIARQERVKYVASEVAHIQNVLEGETIARSHRRLNRTEEFALRETETTTEKELDLQTTEKFALQQEVATTISESEAINVGVNISASYGPWVSVDSNFGFTHESSLQRSERTASNFSKETTQRAVERIKERTRELRERRVLEEIEETNAHSLSSPPGRGNISGTYQFVDKIYENQLYNYGKRLIIEVTVPEPGAYLRHLRGLGFGGPPPPPFDLQIADVDQFNYLTHAATWRVTELEPPPSAFLVVPHPVKLRVRDDVANYTAQIEIPDGYQVSYALAAIHAGANHSAWTAPSSHNPGFSDSLRMSLSGVYFLNGVPYSGRQTWPPPGATSPGDDLRRGRLPLTIGLIASEAAYPEVDIGIAFICVPTAERTMKWRIMTYGALLAGFEKLQSRYNELRAAAEIGQGVPIAGDNPAINRARERRELKRSIIETLLARYLGGVETMRPNPTLGAHRLIDFQAMGALTPEIRFFESVFDWENITYKLDPYFWAHAAQWDALNAETEPDPLFMQFLQAGAATVRVPVQRGEEARALYLLDFGGTWDREDLPPYRLEREPIIALAQSFEANLQAEPNGVTFGDPWLVRVPTSLVSLAGPQGLPGGWIALAP
jgi:hypothetical protein